MDGWMEIVNDACMHMMLCAFVFVQNVIGVTCMDLNGRDDLLRHSDARPLCYRIHSDDVTVYTATVRAAAIRTGTVTMYLGQ